MKNLWLSLHCNSLNKIHGEYYLNWVSYRTELNQNGDRNLVAYLWTQAHPWCINYGFLLKSLFSLFISLITFSFQFSNSRYRFQCLMNQLFLSDFWFEVRPQPSWDRTCTAAAAIGLLDELHLLPELSSLGLDKQAEAVENALEVLLEALTARRLRMGRSVSRKERHKRDIC